MKIKELKKMYPLGAYIIKINLNKTDLNYLLLKTYQLFIKKLSIFIKVIIYNRLICFLYQY